MRKPMAFRMPKRMRQAKGNYYPDWYKVNDGVDFKPRKELTNVKSK